MAKAANGTTRDRRDLAAVAATFALLAAGLYGAFVVLDRWAAVSFARPMMASALVGACEVALLVLALALAPPLSRLVRRLLGGASMARKIAQAGPASK